MSINDIGELRHHPHF